MKVLFVTSWYPNEKEPWYCIFLEQQALALKALGCETDVLIVQPYPAFLRYKKAGVLKKNKSDIKSATVKRLSSRSLKKNTQIREPKIFHGLRLYIVPYEQGSPLELLLAEDHEFMADMAVLLFKERYDVVSIHYLLTDTALKMCLKVCSYCGIKTAVHFHGLNVWKDYYQPHPLLQYYRAIRRRHLLRRADCLIGVSGKVSSIIREKIRRVPTFTVYNGADTNLFHPEQQLKRKDLFRIICIGNLIPIKGQRYLIAACARLKQDKVPVDLVLIGKGKEEERLKALTAFYHAEAYIHFLGALSYERVAGELAASDVFVLPSYYEALGCVYLEAMAAGLPVIAVKGQGIDEIITDGVNGFLVDPKSSGSICRRLSWIYHHRSEAEKIAEKGYATVLQSYRWSDSAAALRNIYCQLGKDK